MVALLSVEERRVPVVGLRRDICASGNQQCANGAIAVLSGSVECHKITRLACIDIGTCRQ
jgi:hypothetical protein